MQLVSVIPMSRACSQLCIGLSRTGTDEKKGRAEGRTEGLAEGMEKGEAKGRVENRLKNARNLKKNGVPIDVIAISLGLTEEETTQL